MVCAEEHSRYGSQLGSLASSSKDVKNYLIDRMVLAWLDVCSNNHNYTVYFGNSASLLGSYF